MQTLPIADVCGNPINMVHTRHWIMLMPRRLTHAPTRIGMSTWIWVLIFVIVVVVMVVK